MVDFWDWFDARREERVKATMKKGDQLKAGQTWASKYETVQAIFDLYRPDDAEQDSDDLDFEDIDFAALLSEFTGIEGMPL